MNELALKHSTSEMEAFHHQSAANTTDRPKPISIAPARVFVTCTCVCVCGLGNPRVGLTEERGIRSTAGFHTRVVKSTQSIRQYQWFIFWDFKRDVYPFQSICTKISYIVYGDCVSNDLFLYIIFEVSHAVWLAYILTSINLKNVKSMHAISRNLNEIKNSSSW